MKRREGIFPELIEPPPTIDTDDPGLRRRMWNLLDDPNSSGAAWAFGLFSMSVVVGSVVTASLETMSTARTGDEGSSMWSTIELVINIWFLVEFILRLLCSGDVRLFFRGFMNVVDVLAILPYFLIIVLRSKSFGNLLQFFKTLKFLRVCRLFRFSRHSKRLTVAGKIIQSCLGSFRLLLTCFGIVVVFGGAVLLNLEEAARGTHGAGQGEGDFESIPAGLWWAVQTLTTVGYGDLVPSSAGGKMFASAFMLLGVAATSLPILTIVSQFVRLYPKNIELVSNSGEERLGAGAESGITIPRTAR